MFSAILLAVVFAFGAQAQTTEEEKAILKLIEAETADFTKLSFAEVAKKHWLLDEKTFICATDGQGNARFLRKEDMLGNETVAPEEKTIVEKTDYIFTIVGDLANVYSHQKVTLPEHNYSLFSHEVRTLKKVDGAWKLYNLTVVHYTPKD